MSSNSRWSRRRFLISTGAGAAGLWLGGCSTSESSAGIVGVTGSDIAAREAQRVVTGAGRKVVDLTAGPVELDLAGRTVRTVAYNGLVPGPEIRVRAGDELTVNLKNELTDPTTIHWHGLAIRNDMDGVPNVTQDPTAAGELFTYRFIVPDPGTHWFHPHMGLDLDRGMYAPIIVEDPAEPGDYDVESVLVLDDWLDDIDGNSPETTFAALLEDGGMGGMSGMMGGGSDMGAMMDDQGDVDYPMHLLNGRPSDDPPTVNVPGGGRVRLRLINAGSDTLYRVAVGGQSMTVTHLDGFPIEPIEVDAVSLSMGERVDVVVEPTSGVWPIVALAERKPGQAMAWLRTSDSTATVGDVPERLPEHDKRLLDVTKARATEAVALPATDPDRVVDVGLTGSMSQYAWGINGAAFGDHEPIEVDSGERLRLRFSNQTMMVHPMHLHGHTFALAGERGARKDTVLVNPMQSVSIDVVADNPGRWMLHCHNTYHLEAGMATELTYRK